VRADEVDHPVLDTFDPLLLDGLSDCAVQESAFLNVDSPLGAKAVCRHSC
jgi:hypothetical protein